MESVCTQICIFHATYEHDNHLVTKAVFATASQRLPDVANWSLGLCKNCLFRFRLDLMVVLNRKLLVTLNMMHHPFWISLVKKEKNQPQKHIHQSHRGFSASYSTWSALCLKDNIFLIKAKSLLSKVEPLVWLSVSLTRAAGLRGSSQSHSRRCLPSISLMSLRLCVQHTGSGPELKDSEKDVCRK